MDTYKTISKPSAPLLFKERKSKFYGYCFPVSDEDSIKEHIEALRKVYPTANHVCYAWQMGVEAKSYRANDDGEPKNSAGQPIYGQLLSKELTNVILMVIRYFGGTKLGVGGLIQAYKTTAELTLDGADLITRQVQAHLQLNFNYRDINKVMRIIKSHNLQLKSQKMELACEFVLTVNAAQLETVLNQFKGESTIKVKQV